MSLWFAPALRSVRTISAGGVANVEPTLNDFMRMTVFTHLQPVYSNKTWVRVDSDQPGQDVVTKLCKIYADWPEGRIKTLAVQQFEENYPKEFGNRVQQLSAITNKQEKRERKKEAIVTRSN